MELKRVASETIVQQCGYMAGITFFILKNKRPTVVYNAYTEEAGGHFGISIRYIYNP